MDSSSTLDDVPRPSPLEIPELLAHVFEQMRDDTTTLARCARVCKAWSGRALATLWSGPVWASALTTVLPEATASATPFGLHNASSDPLRNQRFLLKMPSAQEIAHMNEYAGLVEHLRFDESDGMHPWVSSQLRFPKLRSFEIQPMLDLEAVLTIGPLCGPQITRVLLDLDEQDEENESDEEDEQDFEVDPVWGFAEQYDTAASYTLINHVASTCPNLTTLDLCLGKRTSPLQAFQHLAPLKGTLKRLSFFFRNFSASRPNELHLRSLKALDGFDKLERLEIRTEEILDQVKQGEAVKPLELPSLRTVILMDLSTEQLPTMLARLPSSITDLSIFEPAVVPGYGTAPELTRTAVFCAALRRFAGLESLQIASDDSMPEGSSRVYSADADFLLAVLETARTHLVKLHTLRLGLGRAELPELSLSYAVSGLPDLKHLGLITRNFSTTELAKLPAESQLETLAVSPWIITPSQPTGPLDPLTDLGKWSFPALRRFGEFASVELMREKPRGRRQLKEVVEASKAFVDNFPAGCAFGPIHPLTKHYTEDSFFYAFQNARNDGAPDDVSMDSDSATASDGTGSDASFETVSSSATTDDGNSHHGGASAGDGWVDEVDDGADAGEWTDEDDGF